MARPKIVTLESGPIDLTVLIDQCKKHDVTSVQRIEKAKPMTSDYDAVVRDLSAVLKVKARRSSVDILECGRCFRRYPDLIEYKRCPFCNSDDVVTNDRPTDDDNAISPAQAVAAIKDKELADRVAQIETLGRKTMRALYEIGVCFRYIEDKELWKRDLELEPDSFSEWIEARTGWSFSTAERLIKVARNFTGDQIEKTTRVKISGLLDIEKVMRGLPPEQQETAKEIALQKAEQKGKTEERPVTRQEVQKIAAEVRKDLIGDDDDDEIVDDADIEVSKPEPAVIAQRAPEPLPVSQAELSSRKWTVPWTFQKTPGQPSVGDVFKIELPGGQVIEVKISADEVNCYQYVK